MKKSLKCTITVLLTVFVVAGGIVCGVVYGNNLKAEAATEYNEGHYTYTVTDGKATITSCYRFILGDVTIPSELGGYPVTNIGNRAFSYCEFTSLIIPESVTSVGSSAFNHCKELTSVTFEGVASLGSDVFLYCENLSTVNIPEGFTSIDDKAFRNCEALTSIVIPDSVTRIGCEAFEGCTGLTSVVIGEDSQLKSIEEMAFENCVSLTSIAIPEGVTSIVRSAFDSCINLTSVTFSAESQLKDIGDRAFRACESLTSISIPEGVTSIGKYAFEYCSDLKSIVLPKTLTYLGRECFSFNKDGVIYYPSTPDEFHGIMEYKDDYYYGMVLFECFSEEPYYCYGELGENLEWILNANRELVISGSGDMPSSYWYGERPWGSNLLTVKKVIFDGEINNVADYSFEGCTYLEEIVFSESITEIGGNAFKNCESLKNVFFPKNLTTIGSNSFYGCDNLKSISFPENIAKIGNLAFEDCVGLLNISIPDSLESLAVSAFNGCDNLQRIDYTGTFEQWCNIDMVGNTFDKYHILYIGGKSFLEISGDVLVIPDGTQCIGDYAFSGCSEFTGVVIPKSVTEIGKNAFIDCENLKSVYYSGDISDWCNIKFNSPLIHQRKLYINNVLVSGNIEITGDVACIGNYAFQGYEEITGITICDGVEEIGAYAFKDCLSLSKVIISDSVKLMGVSAFRNCSAITELTVPISMEYALGNDSIVISPGSNTFQFMGCTNIKHITISKGTGKGVDYSTHSWGGSFYKGTPWYISRDSIESITIEEGITEIGSYTFYDNGCLKSIVLPESLVSVGEYAFGNCVNLKNIKLPDNVKYISNAFSGCTSMEKIEIGKGLESADIYSLGYCDFLSVSEESPNFSTDENGVLYTKDKTELIRYPMYSKVTEFLVPDSVTIICKGAFENCTGITSVTFPDSLNSIGDSAFRNCSTITRVSIPASVTKIGERAFYGCSSLRTVTIGEGVENIGENAFGYCNELTTVNFNAIDCKEMKTPVYDDWGYLDGHSSVFYPTLVKVNIGSEVKIIPKYAFCDCSAIIEVDFKNANSLEEIGDYAFKNCKALTMIEIPEKVNMVGYQAFAYCEELISVHISETTIVNTVYSAFYNSAPVLCCGKSGGNVSKFASLNNLVFRKCNGTHTGDEDLGGKFEVIASGDCGENLKWKIYGDCRLVITGSGAMYDTWKTASDVPWKSYRLKIKKIELPNGITSIGNYAFSYFKKIEEVTIPENITLIGAQAFLNCKNIEKVYFNAMNCEKMATHYEYYDYPDVDVEIFREGSSTAFDGCSKLETVVFGNKVKTVPYYAFWNCDAITQISLPDSVTSVKEGAFRDCGSLENVDFSDNLTEIGIKAFYNCDSLERIEIPEGITKIEPRTFSASNKLKYVTLPESLKVIGYSAFSSCTDLRGITIPKNVETIGVDAFFYCRKMTELYFNAENLKNAGIGSYGGGETWEGEPMSPFSHCVSLKSIVVGDNVNILPESMFSLCGEPYFVYDMEFVHLPSTDISLGWNWYPDGYICATTANSAAKAYADKNGIEFRICNGDHGTHFHIPDNWVITKTATETSEGEKTAKCMICAQTVVEKLPKLDIRSITDTLTGITAQYNANNFSGQVGVSVKVSENEEVITLVEERTGFEKIHLNSVSLTVDGVETQPDEAITMSIPVPEGYDSQSIEVYSVNPQTGVIKKLDSNIENNLIVFEANDVSYFAVVEKKGNNNDNNNDNNEGGDTSDTDKSDIITIKKPTTTIVNYGDTLILYANVSNIPEGCSIKWTVEGTGVKLSPSADGKTCSVTCTGGGTVSVKAAVVDVRGNVISDKDGNEASASQILTAKAGFFQKLISFFKNLFGVNRIISQAIKNIF